MIGSLGRFVIAHSLERAGQSQQAARLVAGQGFALAEQGPRLAHPLIVGQEFGIKAPGMAIGQLVGVGKLVVGPVLAGRPA